MPTEPLQPTLWSTTQTTAQYRAIAWLRWRIFLNNFRARIRGGELIATILIVPFSIVILFAPTIAAGVFAGYFAHSGQLDRIAWILWAAFFFCQFLNIQIGQPGTTFDPTQLIRFPLRASSYIAIRLFFGLLSPANIASFFIALAVAIGVTVVLPQLWLVAFVAMFVFFAVNVLFSRMVFAWVDRWLSTRRAREVFTACIFIFSLGIQWLNLTFNPAYHHHARVALHGTKYSGLPPEKLDALTRLYQHVLPWIAGLPPNLTASALAAAKSSNELHALTNILLCALYAACFYAIFAWRTRTEYRGENLSSQASSVAKTKVATPRLASEMPETVASLPTPSTIHHAAQSGLATTLPAVLGKDFLTMRRNAGVFYAILAPLLPALYLVIKNASIFRSEWLFPAALGVSLLGLAPLSFNIFGLEGPGCQLYFITPIRMRDVIFAKNVLILAIGLLETSLVYAIITFNAGRPSLSITLAALLWMTAALLFCIMAGNRRSILSPKKIEAGRAVSRQASQASGLIAMGILLGCATVGAALFAAEWYFDIHWLLLPGMLAFAALAVFLYRTTLESIDTFAYNNREFLFEELCKQ